MSEQRLFIAIDLPLEVREALGQLPPAARGVRPVKRDNIHLTLHFVGQADAEPIIGRLHSVASTCIPFEMRVSGVGFFRGRNRSSVLWAGVDQAPELARLHRELGGVLEQLEIAVDTRPFQPHITVARGDRVPPDQLRDFVDYHADFAASVAVDSFVLYSSELTPSGPTYTVQQRYRLSGAMGQQFVTE